MSLSIYHQNFRGLKHKIDELACSFIAKELHPYCICMTEHYLTEQKLLLISHESYVVGSKSSRPDQLFKKTEIKQLCHFST